MATGKILLGLSFFNQTGEVTDTLKTFGDQLGNNSYEIVLGLENEKSRSQVEPVLDSLRSQGWPTCYIWDDDVNRSAMRSLDRTKALPFFANFSYGAAVNRMLLLATASGCEYLVRVDPGTGCPPNMAQLIDWHTRAISRGRKVVSGQYSDRVAIRDDFVKELQRDDYYQFVQAFTGVNCRPGCQITGGAAMTLSAEGPPAIVFDKVRVWASDDGFFQSFLGQTETEVQVTIKINRSEPGIGLQLSTYIARIAAMVVLHHAHEAKNSELALREARRFLQNVGQFVSPRYSYNPAEAEKLIAPEVDVIYSGYQNYLSLLEQWPVTARRVLHGLAEGTLRAW